MKKIYTLIYSLLFFITVQAQIRSTGHVNGIHMSPNQNPVSIAQDNDSRAPGDTLMYMPLDVYYINPVDSAAFEIVTEDVDLLTPYNSGVPMDYGVYYSTNTDTNASGQPTGDNFYHPWEDPLAGDTTFFWYATSWFNPPGQANNWLMFGPITIPGTGATLMWYEKCNPAYRDGYQVKATTTSSMPITSTDFTDPSFYTRTSQYPSSTYATDTIWVLKTVSIPATYNGQSIYIGYNHDANDMDVLYLDEITVIETPVGINSINAGANHLFENFPNPAQDETTISYSLEKSSNVSFTVTDVTGRVVKTIEQGNQSQGNHNFKLNTQTLNSGVYFVNINAGGILLTTRLMVSK
jgi:hypothetical protein